MIPRAMKGGVAILDQGLTAGSGFLIGILLARWLTREQYGSFAVNLSVIVFLTMLYQSFLLEPMSVYGGAVSTTICEAIYVFYCGFSYALESFYRYSWAYRPRCCV